MSGWAILSLRSRVLSVMRQWFEAEGFLEVETPVRVAVPALEPHIDAERSGTWFLRTSPEFHMKRLIHLGASRIYQIGSCFRKGERGPLHHPEFTLLEWYRAEADYRVVLEDARRLLQHVFASVLGSLRMDRGNRVVTVADPWEILDVSETFRRFAGWDPRERFDPDRFDFDLVNRVEPHLPRDSAVVLCDYPVEIGALACRKAEDPRVVERWELYLAGVELANAFSELTDAAEQRARFLQWAEDRRSRGKDVYPLDEAFLQALERGLPPCAGVALGVDRLVMLLSGETSVASVRAFASDGYDPESEPDAPTGGEGGQPRVVR